MYFLPGLRTCFNACGLLGSFTYIFNFMVTPIYQSYLRDYKNLGLVTVLSTLNTKLIIKICSIDATPKDIGKDYSKN